LWREVAQVAAEASQSGGQSALTAAPERTPIIVMAEQYGADMEGKDVQVDDTKYVTYLEDGQQLMNLLHRLCPV